MNNNYKQILFILCLIPVLLMAWDAFYHQLGSKPIEAISQRTGNWVLVLLLITLAVSPLKNIFGWTVLVRYRRMLGLFVFFYACLHMATYLVLDQAFNIYEIAKDIIKRPYIAIGFTAFLLTIPLAVTSTNKMKKRLGKRWKSLHQLVYLIGLLGVVHYLWMVKKDFEQPLLYASIYFILMAIRVMYRSGTQDIAQQNSRCEEVGESK